MGRALGLTVVLVVLAAAHGALAKGPGIVKVEATIDVPAGIVAGVDADRHRPGQQVEVQATDDGSTLAVREKSRGTLLASEPVHDRRLADGFAAGGRLFLTGGGRVWTPAFDAARSFAHADPVLPCSTSPGLVAGSFEIDAPTGFVPKRRTLVDANTGRAGLQLRALVYDDAKKTQNRARIETTDGIQLGGDEDGKALVRGGFAFAHAVFAYGTRNGRPTLWSPSFDEDELERAAFVACDPAASPLASATVDSRPDVSRSAGATIGTAGGTLDADAADGTHFRLHIPAGALATPTQITIAPASPAGLEAATDAVRAAVDLQPNGLELAQPGILTITRPFATGTSVALEWEDGTAGVDASPGLVARDGRSMSLLIEHFSGRADVQLRANSYAGLVANVRRGVKLRTGNLASLYTSGDFPAAARLLAQVYDTQVEPLIDTADTTVVALAAAAHAYALWAALASDPNLAPVSVPRGGGSQTLAAIDTAALNDLTGKGESLLAQYSADPGPASCTGTVTDLPDWVVIPDVAGTMVALLGGNQSFTTCLRLQVDAVAFPAALVHDDEFEDVAFTVVVSAPLGTRGGTPTADGRVGFPEAADVAAQLHGGIFEASGAATIHQSLPAGTVFRAHVDRGSDETLRASTLRFDADVTGVDLAPVVGPTFVNPIHVHFQASEPVGITVQWQASTPTAFVLPADGGTNHVCVDVFDSNRSSVAHQLVELSLDGPGAISSTTAFTNSLGTACVDYIRPQFPVPKGLTAILTATTSNGHATSRDVAVLTTDWMDVKLSMLGNDGSVAGPFVTGTMGVRPGVKVQIDARVFVSAAGAPVTDPGVPCPACPAEFDLESGGGGVISGDGITGSHVPMSLDGNSEASVIWDPLGSTVDTTVSLLVGAGGVGASVTFTHGTIFRGTLTYRHTATYPPASETSQLDTASVDVVLRVADDGTVTEVTGSGTLHQEFRHVARGVGDARCVPPVQVFSLFDGAVSGVGTYFGSTTDDFSSFSLPFTGEGSTLTVDTPDDVTCVTSSDSGTTTVNFGFGLRPVFDSSGRLVALDAARSEHSPDGSTPVDDLTVTGELVK